MNIHARGRERADLLDRPNILWICSDQQRWDTIRSLGNPHINTPNLDRLAAEGVACTEAFCQAPICTPSRASFLTGMYPSSIRASTNGNIRWAEAAPLVTKIMADNYYCCGLSGKLHLAGAHGRVEPRPKDDGYAVYHWSHSHRDIWPEGHAYSDWVREKGHDLGKEYAENGWMPPELHQSTFCAEKAVEFIERPWDQPWLFSVNIFDPHLPFDAPPEYKERYKPEELPEPAFRESDLAAQERLKGVDFQSEAMPPEQFDARDKKASYYGMIELIDWNVGCMLEALYRTGQRENTLVIFTSDHGEMLGDHGLIAKGCRFYEPLVHVPLIFSMPGTLPTGVKTDALVELTDLAPTLLDLAGLKIPLEMAGRSLLPLLKGETDTHREYVRCEYYDALSHVNLTREVWEGSRATMIRDRRYKLVTYHGHETGELFDLENDPGEFDNRWDDPAMAEVRFRLMKTSFDQTAFAVDTGPEATQVF
jgi:arylsulfatase